MNARYTTRLLMIGCGLVLGGMGCADRNSSTPSQTPAVQPALNLELSSRESAHIARAESALAVVAKKSPTASQLRDFYLANGVPAKIVDDEHVMIIRPLRSDSSFFVVAHDRVVVSRGPHMLAASYQRESRSLHLFLETGNLVVDGVYLAHEILHAYDDLVGGEEPGPPLSDPWIGGELHAHATVYLILNEYTNGRWRDALRRAMNRRNAVKQAQKASSRAFAFGTDDADSSDVVRLFGPLSPDALSALTTELVIGANLMNNNVVAGRDSALAEAGAFAFMREWYGRSGMFATE